MISVRFLSVHELQYKLHSPGLTPLVGLFVVTITSQRQMFIIASFFLVLIFVNDVI